MIGNMLPILGKVTDLGLSAGEAAELGRDAATRIRTFRLILLVATELRTLMDKRLRGDGLTTQQAALASAVEALGTPSVTEAATALGMTHQNIRRLADALNRKDHLRIDDDPHDRRTRRLSVTAKSRRHWQRRARADQEAVLEWFAVLTRREARTLFELLLRLENNLRDELGEKTAGQGRPSGLQS